MLLVELLFQVSESIYRELQQTPLQLKEDPQQLKVLENGLYDGNIKWNHKAHGVETLNLQCAKEACPSVQIQIMLSNFTLEPFSLFLNVTCVIESGTNIYMIYAVRTTNLLQSYAVAYYQDKIYEYLCLINTSKKDNDYIIE